MEKGGNCIFINNSNWYLLGKRVISAFKGEWDGLHRIDGLYHIVISYRLKTGEGVLN